MMGRDFGSKPGAGGPASASITNAERKERLRRLGLAQVDLAKDPYFSRNHIGSYECKLCLTLHNNEGNYLAHTQGKRHQTNLKRRAAREAKRNALDGGSSSVSLAALSAKRAKKVAKKPKIGQPGYKVTKQYDPETKQRGLLFQIHYPEIEKGLQPRHRFMSSFQQRVEPVDPNYQYLLFAADPYETIAFKVPNRQVERDMERCGDRIFSDWDRQKLVFTLQIQFHDENAAKESNDE